MKMSLIKSFSSGSVVKELIALNKKFISTLMVVNSFFEKNQPIEALKKLEDINSISEKIEEYKKQLPTLKNIENDHLISTIKEQQIELNKISKKTQYLMEVHLELASSAREFVKTQLAKEREADMGYNRAGSINSSFDAYRPISYVSEI